MNSPLIVLLEQEGADQAGDRVFVREDADDLRPSLDLTVEALEWIGAVKLCPVRGREAHVGEHIGLGVIHQGGEPWQLRPELIGDSAPLLGGRSGIVLGGYALSHWLHVSGPIAMAVAGLLIGNHGVAHAMSDTTRDYLLKFWSLIDAILNAVLFLLIGLEILTLPADLRLLLLGLLAIPLVMGARAVSVLAPLALLRPVLDLGRLAPVTLIWGGMRGGISVALALGLPEGPMRTSILAATYMVVLFSVLVQGATIERVLRKAEEADSRSLLE